jgi:hypothetical protein
MAGDMRKAGARTTGTDGESCNASCGEMLRVVQGTIRRHKVGRGF